MAALIGCTLLFAGCNSAELDRCARRNTVLGERNNQLESMIDLYKRQAEKAQQESNALSALKNGESKQIAALMQSLQAKKAIIADLMNRVGQTALPIDLSNALSKWAQDSGSDLVQYDDQTGMVRFKSDLVFNTGETSIKPDAVLQLKAFSQIMTMDSAKDFDVLVVGHTDNMPIKRAITKAKHPTNWHLSVHRAISVKDELENGKIGPQRLSVKGFGEYHPLEPNQGTKGNKANRRVEIFIVPAGSVSE